MKNLQNNSESATEKLAHLHESLREQQQASALAQAAAQAAANAQAGNQGAATSQIRQPAPTPALPFNFSAASLLLGANPLYSQIQGQSSQVPTQHPHW